MKAVAHATPGWPQLEERLRAQVKFWRSHSWRHHVKRSMKRLHIDGVDLDVLDHFSVSMAKWRYETIAIVTWFLQRLRPVMQHVRPEWFQNTQERQVIHDLFEGARDESFWRFVSVSEREVWSKAESDRHWGMTCPCERHIADRIAGAKHIECVFNGRKLPLVTEHVDRECVKLRTRAAEITEVECENDKPLWKIIKGMLRQLASKTHQRFKYLANAPWSFSCTMSVDGATNFVTQVEARPLDEHDPLTRTIWAAYGDDTKQRAAGGDTTPRHADMVRRMNLSNVDEAPGEGCHRTTTHEKQRASASSSQHLKQTTRAKSIYKRMKLFRRRYGKRADDVLRHDWRTWKRLLQGKASRRWDPVKMPRKAFFGASLS